VNLKNILPMAALAASFVCSAPAFAATRKTDLPPPLTAFKQTFDTGAAGFEADAAQPTGAKEATKP
jgi:hypothetical protein